MDNREQVEEIGRAEAGVSRRRFLRDSALVGAGLMAAPLLLTPQAAQAGLISAPSPADQKQIGDKAAQDILKKYREVFDGRARHFNDIGQRLVSSLPSQDRRTWDFRFHVLDSKEVNAFALPGGPMFMFTGLYERLGTDDALAAVTGHEMTHVREQHWAKAYAKEQERNLALGALLSIFKAGRAAQTLASLANSAVSLKFSRGEEDQADTGGLDNMVAAGFNPQGMILLFQTLQRVSGGGGMPAFLSDHPLTTDRIKAAQQRIARIAQQRNFPTLTPFDYRSLY